MILAKIPHNNGRLDCAQEALELARRLSDNRLIQEAERIIQNPNQREMGTRLQRPSSGNAQQVGAAAAAAAAEQNSPPQGFYQGSDGYWYHPGFRGVPFIVAVDGYFRHPNFPQLQLFSDAITGQVFYWYFNQTTGEWLYCPWNHGQR
jgi:hypothetical protein